MKIAELREIIRRNLVDYERAMHEPAAPASIHVNYEGRRDAEYDILKLIAEPTRKEHVA